MDKEKDTFQDIRSGFSEEWQKYISKYSDRDLKMILDLANAELSGTNANEGMSRQECERICEKILDEPFFYLQTFCFILRDMKRKEDTILSPIKVSSYPAYNISRCLLFIYGSVEAGKIKSLSKEIRGGDELRSLYDEYTVYLHSSENCLFLDAANTSEFCALIARYVEVLDGVRCNINPREVIEYLYSTATGKSFLPLSLIAYLEDKQKKDNANTSQAIPMPYIPTPSQKEHNRSGSKINPEKHEKTKNACQKAWEKIQQDKILDVNAEIFSEIASSFLGQGESLVSTVSRAFYKEEVAHEYKAGAGRKSK